MKALKKQYLAQKKLLQYAISEANIIKSCKDHPFIINLYYAFQTTNYLYMILDYCVGGDLALNLIQMGTFDENIAKFYLAELVLAIEHLHKQNIIYRDLKPENIMIYNDGHIKLVDFGLSKQGVDELDKSMSFCGSPAYLTPEMLKNQGVGQSGDIYQIGIVLFEMLTGDPPFYSDNLQNMYTNIQTKKLSFAKNSNFSQEAKNFMQEVLEKDPTKRIMNIQAVKEHKFFECIDWNLLQQKEYPPPFTDFEEENDSVPEKVNFKDVDYDTDDTDKQQNFIVDFNYSQI